MGLTLKYENGRFNIPWDGDKNVGQELYNMGFNYDFHSKAFWTAEARVSKQLIHNVDSQDTLVKIYELDALEKATRESSKATEASLYVPKNYGLDYLPYQYAAVQFAQHRPNILVADQMGLGKTIEALGIINWYEAYKKPVYSVLIICKASLKYMWARECGKWLVRERGIGVVNGGSFPMFAQVVIISYNALSNFETELRSRKWDFVVVDEGHYLTNPAAIRTQYVFGDASGNVEPLKTEHMLILTGTPFRNRPIELFPMLHYLDPDTYPNRVTYGKRYCDGFKTRTGKWNFQGESNLEELNFKLRSSVMIRRLKDEVLKDLPKKRRQVIEIPAGENDVGFIKDELDAYNSYQGKIDEAKAAAKAAKELNDQEAFYNEMKKVRQLISVQFREIAKYRHRTAVAKIPYVLSHLEDLLADGENVIVFAHHHEVVEKIIKTFPQCAYVYGKNATEGLMMQDKFQNDPNCNLFVGSIGAASAGLTLVKAGVVVFAELDWVPANMTQAEDRGHRIGQLKSLLIQILVLQRSLDARLVYKIVDKQGMYDRALDSNVELDDLPINASL